MKHSHYTMGGGMLVFLSILILAGIAGCEEQIEEKSLPYDSSRPVTITDFSPHKGGAKTRMIIFGSNFGTDPSIISVKIGGYPTKVITAKGDILYCITPAEGHEGTIELQVGDSAPVVAADKFEYEKKPIVSTLCGHVDELGKGKVLEEAPFDKVEKIDCPAWLSFDPKNHSDLYCVQDDGNQNNKPLLKFDLANEYMSTTLRLGGNLNRLRTIAWTPYGDTMVVATAKGQDNALSNIMLKRSDDFKKYSVLTKSHSCQSSVIHPENGELYYSRFKDGTMWRYDFRTWGDGNNGAHAEMLFSIQDTQWEFNMVQHPSGDYMYIIVVNRHYIMRSNYDRVNKRYSIPYVICGGIGVAGYADLVGTKARLNTPVQGVFVKNPEYEKKGEGADQYDFYFTDSGNHCIRKLTPNGIVSTYAGRGSTGMNNNAWGYVDGDLREEARFNGPKGIAYDAATNTFYISDTGNHRIRKISVGFDEESGGSETSDNDTESDNVPENN